jgi:hypothetical protein
MKTKGAGHGSPWSICSSIRVEAIILRNRDGTTLRLGGFQVFPNFFFFKNTSITFSKLNNLLYFQKSFLINFAFHIHLKF